MSQFVIWQGFEHEWEREVLGFRLAHRLGSLVNYIDEVGQRAMVVGASPGVDGNFMRPQCFYRPVDAPGVSSHARIVELRGTDCLEDSSGAPEACLLLSGVLEHTLAKKANTSCDAVLAGIDLSWRCDADKQPEVMPGNSDAVWPIELDVCIDAPRVDGDTLSWEIRVRVVRGWTPMHGGIPMLEEKALNHAMDLVAKVHISIVEGEGSALAIERHQGIELHGRLRDYSRQSSPIHVGADRQAVTAMTQFGFVMAPRRGRGPLRHRGRYLSALGFGIQEEGQGHTGWARVWAPITVVPAEVHYSITSATLGFAADATLQEQRTATGAVHSNSSDKAPFFSKWKKFKSDQTRDRVPLA